MRSSNELSVVMVYYYLSALRVASDDRAALTKEFWSLNDLKSTLPSVSPKHITIVSIPSTPTHGPLGLIMKQEILYFKTAEPRVRFDLDHIQGL